MKTQPQTTKTEKDIDKTLSKAYLQLLFLIILISFNSFTIYSARLTNSYTIMSFSCLLGLIQIILLIILVGFISHLNRTKKIQQLTTNDNGN